MSDKTKSHRIVRIAKQSGKLIQMPCCKCGKENSEAHHSDYSKPLDVEWLCKFHHRQAHKLTGDWAKKPRNRKRIKLLPEVIMLIDLGIPKIKISKILKVSRSSIYEWINRT